MGNGDALVDRNKVDALFERLGALLQQERQQALLAVFGGTAVMLQVSGRAATADLDCVVLEGHGAVFRAMDRLRKATGTPAWINEAVSVYRSRNETDWDFISYGSYPVRGAAALRATLARPEYLLAMKVEALPRNAPRDSADVRILARTLRLRSVGEVLDVHGRYFQPTASTVLLERALEAP